MLSLTPVDMQSRQYLFVVRPIFPDPDYSTTGLHPAIGILAPRFHRR